MTGIEFRSVRASKLDYAAAMLRKAYASGAKVVVTGEPELLARLDDALWRGDPASFLPHCIAEQSAAAVVAASPVVLATGLRGAPHRQVLVNLGSNVPEGFESFDRLIEVVGQDAEDRGLGRQRWRHYEKRGYALRHREVAEDA